MNNLAVTDEMTQLSDLSKNCISDFCGDFNDFLMNEQKKLLDEHTEGFSLINMNDVIAEEVDWLWFPYIPSGKITILQGDPGCGKTTFILALTALLTTGGKFPTNVDSHAPSNVIYQTAEDGLADTIKPRLLSYGANCKLVDVINDSETPLTLDDERIEKAIKSTGAKLFVIDPLQAFLGAKVDMHRANEVRPIFAKLAGVAQRTGCAIVIIGHMNKGSNKGIYRSLGTIDIVAAARSVLLLGKDPNDNNIRAVIPIKASLAPEGKAVSFLVGANGFSWIGECDLTAYDLLSDNDSSQKVISLAEKILIEHCTGKMVLSSELEEIALNQGVSKSTLKRAKSNVGAIARKKDNAWYTTII